MPKITLSDIHQNEWQLIVRIVNELKKSELGFDTTKAIGLINRATQTQPIVLPNATKEELGDLLRLLDFYQVFQCDNIQHLWNPGIPVIEKKLSKWHQKVFH